MQPPNPYVTAAAPPTSYNPYADAGVADKPYNPYMEVEPPYNPYPTQRDTENKLAYLQHQLETISERCQSIDQMILDLQKKLSKPAPTPDYEWIRVCPNGYFNCPNHPGDHQIVANQAEIDQYEEKIEDIQNQIDNLQSERSQLLDQISTIHRQIDETQNELDSLASTTDEGRVSDAAIPQDGNLLQRMAKGWDSVVLAEQNFAAQTRQAEKDFFNALSAYYPSAGIATLKEAMKSAEDVVSNGNASQ